MPRPRQVMLIIETSMAFGRDVLRGINQYVVSHQPWCFYLDLRELIVDPPAWLESWEGDGIICRVLTPDLAQMLRRRKIPTVDLTDITGPLGLPRITNDHRVIGQLAATHLLERGFRHFAFCGFSKHHWSQQRREGFEAELAVNHLSCNVFESPWGTTRKHSWEQQQQEIAEWLTSLPRPLGVFACNDKRGQHVLDACRREDFAVPEEVAVIGVDNDELLCNMCDPPLSSVVPSAMQIGYEAASLLDRLMAGEKHDGEVRQISPLGIVTRQSTDVLAIDDAMVASAVQFIREHACQRITVEDVLAAVPLSRSVLERRFRKYLKRSPQEEIRQVQIKRVRQLLAETDLALEKIADLAGYEHSEYMNVVFKRMTGQTPGQYRRAAQPSDAGRNSPAIRRD